MKLKKSIICLFIIAIALVAVSNTGLGIFLGRPLIHVYHYESTDRGFAEIEVPEKGRDFSFVFKKFKEYKKLPGKSNVQLKRTFNKNIFAFYEWYDFLTHERWNYGYIEPSENSNAERQNI